MTEKRKKEIVNCESEESCGKQFVLTENNTYRKIKSYERYSRNPSLQLQTVTLMEEMRKDPILKHNKSHNCYYIISEKENYYVNPESLYWKSKRFDKILIYTDFAMIEDKVYFFLDPGADVSILDEDLTNVLDPGHVLVDKKDVVGINGINGYSTHNSIKLQVEYRSYKGESVWYIFKGFKEKMKTHGLIGDNLINAVESIDGPGTFVLTPIDKSDKYKSKSLSISNVTPSIIKADINSIYEQYKKYSQDKISHDQITKIFSQQYGVSEAKINKILARGLHLTGDDYLNFALWSQATYNPAKWFDKAFSNYNLKQSKPITKVFSKMSRTLTFDELSAIVGVEDVKGTRKLENTIVNDIRKMNKSIFNDISAKAKQTIYNGNNMIGLIINMSNDKENIVLLIEVVFMIIEQKVSIRIKVKYALEQHFEVANRIYEIISNRFKL